MILLDSISRPHTHLAVAFFWIAPVLLGPALVPEFARGKMSAPVDGFGCCDVSRRFFQREASEWLICMSHVVKIRHAAAVAAMREAGADIFVEKWLGWASKRLTTPRCSQLHAKSKLNGHFLA